MLYSKFNFLSNLQIELAHGVGVYLTRSQVQEIKYHDTQAGMYREVLRQMIPEDILKSPGLSVKGGKGCIKVPTKITSIADGIRNYSCPFFYHYRHR